MEGQRSMQTPEEQELENLIRKEGAIGWLETKDYGRALELGRIIQERETQQQQQCERPKG